MLRSRFTHMAHIPSVLPLYGGDKSPPVTLCCECCDRPAEVCYRGESFTTIDSVLLKKTWQARKETDLPYELLEGRVSGQNLAPVS